MLIEHLEALARGTPINGSSFDRLMVAMPPGSAKSTYASKLFPAWFLAQEPNLSIVGASHTASMAEDFSRDVQSFIRDNEDTLGYQLLNEPAKLWKTSNGGRYRAAGSDGPITGARANLIVADDVLKGRAEADSEVIREKLWKWFRSDLRTRLKPDGKIVIIMTRWHEDDLAGRLLQTQPERWRLLSLPALAEADDPLGRAEGEALWDDDAYGFGEGLRSILSEYEQTGGMRDWYALFQQSPRVMDGSLFKTGQIKVIPAVPANPIMYVRGWDLAATEQIGTRDPDYTVGVLMARYPDGSYVVVDVKRLRGGPEEVEALIRNTASQDGPNVTISLPQDPGQAGKGQVLNLTRMLAGYTVFSSPESGSKVTRAGPFAAQVNVGNVRMVQADWNWAYLDELSSFPSGRKADQVDASSRAFEMISGSGYDSTYSWL